MTTGERIRYYRKLNNITMVELAHRIGVQHSAIYKYETGKVTNIPIGNINKMADVFGTPARELVDWISDDPIPDLELNAEEKAIITLYRKLTERNKQTIKSYLDFILASQGGKE